MRLKFARTAFVILVALAVTAGVANAAFDGQTLSGQTAEVQRIYRGLYGDSAETRWDYDHNHALVRIEAESRIAEGIAEHQLDVGLPARIADDVLERDAVAAFMAGCDDGVLYGRWLCPTDPPPAPRPSGGGGGGSSSGGGGSSGSSVGGGSSTGDGTTPTKAPTVQVTPAPTPVEPPECAEFPSGPHVHHHSHPDGSPDDAHCHTHDQDDGVHTTLVDGVWYQHSITPPPACHIHSHSHPVGYYVDGAKIHEHCHNHDDGFHDGPHALPPIGGPECSGPRHHKHTHAHGGASHEHCHGHNDGEHGNGEDFQHLPAS